MAPPKGKERPLSDLPEPRKENEPLDQENWEREQWEAAGKGSTPTDPEDVSAPEGNKQQWEGEGQDDVPTALEEQEPPATMGEGDSELSGHGKNPSGGKRWATVEPDE